MNARFILPLDTDGEGTSKSQRGRSASNCVDSSAATTDWSTSDFTASECLISTTLGGQPPTGHDEHAEAYPDAHDAADNYVSVILDVTDSVQIRNLDAGRGPASSRAQYLLPAVLHVPTPGRLTPS